MTLAATPLFSNGNFQLYHARFPATTKVRWEISPLYPVSLFFYMKGSKASLERKGTALPGDFLVQNRSNFLYHDKNSVYLSWQQSSTVELIEIRLKKEYLATLIAQEPKHWGTYFKLPGNQQQVLMPAKPLAFHKEFTYIINGILNASIKSAFFKKTIFEAKALELIAAFLERLQQPNPSAQLPEAHSRLAMLAKKHIDGQKGKRDFTIISLAQSLKTNETTLKQAFKMAYGKTIFRYFQEKNMLAAKEALQAGRSIAATATQCGYTHLAHFSIAFKKEFGVPPSRFK